MKGGKIYMAKNTYDMVMNGKSDNNIRFSDLKNLLLSYDFNERIKGIILFIKEKISQKE